MVVSGAVRKSGRHYPTRTSRNQPAGLADRRSVATQPDGICIDVVQLGARRGAEAARKVEAVVYILGEDNSDSLSYGYRDLDGDFSKIAAVDMSRDDGITPTVGSMANVGRLVDGEHMPTRIQREGPKRPTPDVVFNHSIPVVDEVFRNIVERFDPGAHQFFPVDIVWGDGSLAARKYFLVVGRRLDTVNRQLTTMERGKFFYKPVKDGDNRLVFDTKTDRPVPSVA